MTVTNVKTIKQDWKATIKASGTEFSISFLITVDDMDDGPESITMDEGIPQIGDLYEVGNDSTPHECLTKTFTNVDTYLWKLDAKFGFPESKDKKDEEDQNNSESDTPFNEPPTLSIGMVRTETVAAYAAYIGRYYVSTQGVPGVFTTAGYGPLGLPKSHTSATPGDPNSRGGIKNGTAVVNSTFAPYDPPLKRDRGRVGIRVGVNLASFPINHFKLIDAVNKDSWTLNHTWHNFVFTFPKYTCKIQSITGSYKYQEVGEQMYAFWAMEYEFHYDAIFGWRVDLLDYGYSENSNNPSHPLYSPGGGSPAGTSGQTASVGANGLPNRDPVKLDGNGMAIDPDGLNDACFSRWAIYPEYNFTTVLAPILNNVVQEPAAI